MKSCSVVELLRNDHKAAWILGVGLAAQLITAVTQLGQYSSDQYFQLIELSLRQLHEPNHAEAIWEFTSQVRPTLAVYALSGFRLLCHALGVADVFTQLLILRLLMGAAGFCLLNTLIIRRFAAESKMLFHFALLIGSLSWLLPYTRTLYSSESLCALFFLAAILIIDKPTAPDKGAAIGAGALFAAAFFMRFQIAFAILGVLVWMALEADHRKRLGWLTLGGAVSALINVGLDCVFYGDVVLTPMRYFQANIIEGKAATFGTSSFLFYWGELLLVAFAPPLSALLVATLIYGFFKRFKDLYLLCILCFIVGHSLVGHKEARFLFPILGALPLGVCVGWQAFREAHGTWVARRRKTLGVLFRISLALNGIMVALLAIIPYSQDVAFIKKLNAFFLPPQPQTTVYCLKRTPYQTQNHLWLSLYWNEKNPSIRYISKECQAHWDSLKRAPIQYLCLEYNELKSCPDDLLRNMQPVIYSSELLWNINRRLEQLGINTIVNIWALYKTTARGAGALKSKSSPMAAGANAATTPNRSTTKRCGLCR